MHQFELWHWAVGFRILAGMPEAKLDSNTLELFKRSEAVEEKSSLARHHADLISEPLVNTLKRNDALIKEAGELIRDRPDRKLTR